MTLNNGMSLTKSDVGVERARVAALSNEQIYDSMFLTPSEDMFEDYCSNAEVMMTMSRSKIKGLIGKKAGIVRAERTQIEGQIHIKVTPVNTP